MCTAPWRQLSVPLEMAPMSAFDAFIITTLKMCKSGATDRNFIICLTNFNLLDILLSLDCKLPIIIC